MNNDSEWPPGRTKSKNKTGVLTLEHSADPGQLSYEEQDAELERQQRELDAFIAVLEQQLLAAENGVNPKNGQVEVARIIEANVSPEEKIEIKKEFPAAPVAETIAREVVASMNDKSSPRNTGDRPLHRAVSRSTKKLINLLLVGGVSVTTSFAPMKSADSMAYDNIRVNDLKDWDQIKLGQDELNKLENIEVVVKANEHSDKMYVVVDKSAGFAHLYRGGNLITTYEVGTGKNPGDEQTVTVVSDERVYWDQGNKKTGAGTYTVNNRGTYEEMPSWTMINERGIEVPTVFHRALPERRKFFNLKRKKRENTMRMSNGCLNFMANSLSDLARRKEFGKGTKVYILPDDPHNKYQIVDGELRFLSNQQNVNRTIRPYEPKPIILKAENATEAGKEFLLAIQNSKPELMKLYPTVSNDVYNKLAQLAYGILGQESSFGTYGGPRGQWGRIRDRAGVLAGKNVSAGISQIRITSVNPKTKASFGIKTTADLFDNKKAAIAAMSLVLDIYSTNITTDQRGGDYLATVAFYYHSAIGSGKEKVAERMARSNYAKKVVEYSKKCRVYVSLDGL